MSKIKYMSGGQPVSDDTIVLFWLYGEGNTHTPRSIHAKYLKWRKDGKPLEEGDVEYYEVVKPPVDQNLNDKIKYDGKGCPVDLDTIVEIWFKGEFKHSNAGESGEAGEFNWRLVNDPAAITHYRVNSEDKKKYDGNGQPVSDGTSVRVWWKGGNWEVHNAGNIFWPRTVLNHTMDLEYYQILKRPSVDLPKAQLPPFKIPSNMKMTDKANGSDFKYHNFREVGWSDEQLVEEGYMVSEQVTTTPNVRDFNIGDSNYAQKKIQPWDIWLEYDLNPWDADIIKRTLRTKSTQSRRMDYEKIIHVAQERIRQIDEES